MNKINPSAIRDTYGLVRMCVKDEDATQAVIDQMAPSEVAAALTVAIDLVSIFGINAQGEDEFDAFIGRAIDYVVRTFE